MNPSLKLLYSLFIHLPTYLPPYRLVSLFGLVQLSDAASAVVTQGLGLGLGQGQGLGNGLSGTSLCLSADSMTIVLQMLVRGQRQRLDNSRSSNGNGNGDDGSSDYRLVVDLFDLYLKQYNQLQHHLL